MTTQVYVEIYRRSDGHVESRMGPMSEWRALRVECGASINLNHEAYTTRIVDANARDHFERKERALKLMQEIGGSFASNLARAWRKADLSNDARLTESFGDLLEEYAEQADAIKERDESEARTGGDL